MKIKKILAALMSVSLFAAAVPVSGILDLNIYAAEITEKTVVSITRGDVFYNIYSDHAEVDGCFKTAENIEIISEVNGVPVIKIKHTAFLNHDKLKSVIIPDSVKEIGKGAFEGCSGLMSVTIPESVVSIEQKAFDSCSSLKEATILGKITSIEPWTFYECTNLTSLTLPDSLTEIGTLAFSGCNNLMSIKFPDSLKTIGNSAFMNCENLTSIYIPEGVETIDKYAFDGCNNLESVEIDSPDCDIYDNKYTIPCGTIYGHAGSTAQKYAEKYGYEFALLCNCGDVNNDGTVDALDASMVLMDYAAAATGKAPVLDNGQKRAADVNTDGAVDALDASDILRYYAYTATGGTDSLEDFLG